jgi:hypothetical protein
MRGGDSRAIRRANGWPAFSVTVLGVAACGMAIVWNAAPYAFGDAGTRKPAMSAIAVPAAGPLSGVSALSAHSVWAVGAAGDAALVLHWDGEHWKPVPCPSSGGGSALVAVTAVSPTDAWAVGTTAAAKTFVVRWNGKAWHRVPSPSPSPDDSLADVAASSARSGWAVGQTRNTRALIMRWNGKSWTLVPSPTGTATAFLKGVATTSPRNAWAVGWDGDRRTVILHWNGRAWTRMHGRAAQEPGHLDAVAAPSRNNAWAVGNNDIDQTLTLHWNGHAWSRVRAPTPALGDLLLGVTIVSATDVWAVGQTASDNPATLSMHWSGRTWKLVHTPSPGTSAWLSAVTATSPKNVWTVGEGAGDDGAADCRNGRCIRHREISHTDGAEPGLQSAHRNDGGGSPIRRTTLRVGVPGVSPSVGSAGPNLGLVEFRSQQSGHDNDRADYPFGTGPFAQVTRPFEAQIESTVRGLWTLWSPMVRSRHGQAPGVYRGRIGQGDGQRFPGSVSECDDHREESGADRVLRFQPDRGNAGPGVRCVDEGSPGDVGPARGRRGRRPRASRVCCAGRGRAGSRASTWPALGWPCRSPATATSTTARKLA